MILLFTTLAFADQNPPGTTIENALMADIPPSGLESIGEAVPALIPSPIEIPEFAEESSSCPTGGFWYKFQMKRAWADISVTSISLEPQAGYIDYQIDLSIFMNDTADMFRFNYWLVCIKYKCDGYTDPFTAQASGRLYIDLVDPDGDGVLEADVNITDELSISYDLVGDDIHLSNCPLDGLESIFQFFGGSLYDIVLDAVDLESLLSDSLPELETTIEDALSSLVIEQQVDLGGAPLDLSLIPSDIQITPDGIRFALDGSASTPEMAACVAPYDPGGSVKTSNAPQQLTDFPTDYHFGAIASDDFINQALYSVWSAGLLCQTIDDNIFALDTSILNLISGDAFTELFPETESMIIRTSPKSPPTLNMQSTSDLAIDIEELGLDFYADVDYRQTKVLSVDLNTDVGIDLMFNEQTGAIEPNIEINPLLVNAEVLYNEFVPDQDATIETSFVSQLDTILGFIDLDSLLADLNLAIPALAVGEAGFGIQSLDIQPSGSTQDDLALYALTGEVTYASSGCGGCGGEEAEADTGCEGSGCAVGSAGSGRNFLLLAITLFTLRRRRIK